MSKFIEKLKKDLLRENEEGEQEFMLHRIEAKKWPNDSEGSLWDMENHGVIDLLPEEMQIYCGGDWQQPAVFTIFLNEENNFEVKDVVIGVDLSTVNELSEEEVISRITNF